MATTITQWKTPPAEWGAKVQDIAPPIALPTARLAPPPQAISMVAAAVVTTATAELGGRVHRGIVHPTVQRPALQCTAVENMAMAAQQMAILCIQNLKEADQDLSNRTLRQSIF